MTVRVNRTYWVDGSLKIYLIGEMYLSVILCNNVMFQNVQKPFF